MGGIRLKRILIDNTCLDTMCTNEEMYRDLSKMYEFCISSTIVEELACIPDEKKEKRIQTFIAFSKAQVKFVSDVVGVIGTSRIGCFRLPDETAIQVYEAILNESKSNKKDAIIAATAVQENCTLLTNDKKSYLKMKDNKFPVMNFDELCFVYKKAKEGDFHE